VRIEVEKLTPEGEPFAETYAEGELELGDEDASLAGETVVEGRAARKGDEVRMSGRIRSTLAAVCDRCVRPLVLPVEIEFSEAFTPLVPVSSADETELRPDDLHVSTYEGGEIDTDDLAREQLLLSLPTQFVCRDDCRGLCQKCGANLNEGDCHCPAGETDPRWAALADLKTRGD
jgi:uncharacterized protein